MTRAWKIEILRLGGWLALGLLVGAVTGYYGFALFAALGAHTAFTMRNLHRLEYWLRASKKFEPPVIGSGVWFAVFRHIRDLQRRKRKRKRQLSRIVKLFQESTQAMPDGAVVLDERFEVTWINRAARRLLGLRSPQDVGRRIDNLIRNPQFVAHLHDRRYGEPIPMPSPADPRLRLTIIILRSSKKNYLVLAYDQTEQHRAEQIRRDFVANVSHELRTPLTVLKGYLEALPDDAAPTGPIGAMGRQAARMEAVVEDLLLLAKLESAPDEASDESGGRRLDMDALMNRVLEDAQALSGDRHPIRLEIDPNLGLRGREDEVLTAFSNLVFNAVRYTPEGGAIHIHWFRRGERACFEVRDQGIGIPAHHIPRLTERFYRVDPGRSRERGGTGLGLAIVGHVLDRHEAVLEIESEVGVGSTFRCLFEEGRTVIKPSSTTDHHPAPAEKRNDTEF